MLPVDAPDFRISHEDVGKRRLDFVDEDEYGGESVFDIEGEDDLPPNLKEQDL